MKPLGAETRRSKLRDEGGGSVGPAALQCRCAAAVGAAADIAASAAPLPLDTAAAAITGALVRDSGTHQACRATTWNPYPLPSNRDLPVLPRQLLNPETTRGPTVFGCVVPHRAAPRSPADPLTTKSLVGHCRTQVISRRADA